MPGPSENTSRFFPRPTRRGWLLSLSATLALLGAFALAASPEPMTRRIVDVLWYMLPVGAALSLFNGAVIGWSAIRASREDSLPRSERGLLAGTLVSAAGRILAGGALLFGLISGAISSAWLLLVGLLMIGPGARFAAWVAGRILPQREVV